MLVITRRLGESFLVGDDIEIVILEAGSQVRVGIIAPREIKIARGELVAAVEPSRRSLFGICRD